MQDRKKNFSIPFLIEQRINSAETPAGGGAAVRDDERERKNREADRLRVQSRAGCQRDGHFCCR